MSPRREHFRAHLTFALSLVLVSGNVGCWEQWSEDWFPQMKWQKAVQAFERVQHENKPGEPQIDPFMPPDGAVQQGAEPPPVPRLKPENMTETTMAAYDVAVGAFVNPTRADLTQPIPPQSWVRGKQLYQTYCIT